MQDTNNENTQPNRPQEPDAGEETMPTRASRGPVEPESTVPTRVQRDPDGYEATMPTRVQGSAGMNGPESTARITVARSMPVHTAGASGTASPDNAPQTPGTEPDAFAGGKKDKPHGARRWPWILLGLLMIGLLGAAGVWLGYQSAIKMRETAYNTQKVDLAKQYFMAGLVSQQNKQYERAKVQFEEVIKLQPEFPGAQDKLREVLTAMMIVMTPTPPPTATPLPTMTPTKDLRPMDDIFNQAKQQYGAKDWDTFFATVDQIRTQDPSFHAVQIDGMLYFAYRFRGIDKILKQANLEGGLYDLALAERYGPLDQDAKGYQNWARLYLNGASFWDADWKKVVDYFADIYPYFPNLRDSSGLTAIERYRQAAANYAEQLAASGDACGAADYYGKSLSAGADANVAPKATEVELQCHPPTSTPEPTTAPTATVPVPTAEQPTVQPTAETQPTVETQPQPQPTTETQPQPTTQSPAETAQPPANP